MDLLSQEIELSQLNAGDHIYSWRKKLFSHHGIFIGDDKVIHFVNTKREGKGGNPFLATFNISATASHSISDGKKPKTPCPKSYCGSEKVAESGVKMSCIDCFSKKRSINRYKYQANRMFLLAKSVGGTCTKAASDPPEEVIYRAKHLYENGYPRYNLMNNNCEDFALYCKTGLWSTNKSYPGRSSQANMVHSSSSKSSSFITLFKEDPGEQLERIATAIPRCYSKRDAKDLGSRTDLVKVPVQELPYFILSLSNK